MSPLAITSLIFTCLSGLMTAISCVVDQADRNKEIDERIDKKFEEMNNKASEE